MVSWHPSVSNDQASGFLFFERQKAHYTTMMNVPSEEYIKSLSLKCPSSVVVPSRTLEIALLFPLPFEHQEKCLLAKNR